MTKEQEVKLKQKKCSNCKYNFKTEILNCCGRPDKNGLHTLKPLKLLCFRKENKYDSKF